MKDVRIKGEGKLKAVMTIASLLMCMVVILLSLGLTVLAQMDSINTIPRPEDDLFKPELDLVTYNISRTGQDKFSDKFSDTIRIYNADGTLWYEFSLSESHPLFYKKHPKPELSPIFPIEKVLYKMVASSNYWYEIEVNSTTKEIKFMKIHDPFIRRLSIKMEIKGSHNIKFDRTTNPLLDEPNGKAKIFDESKIERFSGVSIQGEWLQVRVNLKDRSDDLADFGWIRWMKDNDLSIGFDLPDK